jgi:hypothetical protein
MIDGKINIHCVDKEIQVDPQEFTIKPNTVEKIKSEGTFVF